MKHNPGQDFPAFLLCFCMISITLQRYKKSARLPNIPAIILLNIVNNIPNKIMVGYTIAPPCYMPSVGIIDEVNIAI